MFDPSKILKIFLFYLHIILFLLMQSCEKDFSGLTNSIDTTSHDFHWETITFDSPYGSGVLNDVAILDENNIWAVGAIYADSAQPWLPYNAVHWDGQQWELKRIKTNACGGVDYPPIKTIFAFSSNDVLFAHIDGSITFFDGISFNNDCRLVTQLNGSANKIWGRSKNDFYVVSGDGFIAHYNGSSWQKLESGTDLPIQDIWGSSASGNLEIICIASDHIHNLGKKVLRISDNQVEALPDSGLSWSLSGIWFISNTFYGIVGDGAYFSNKLGAVWQRDTTFPSLYKDAIRGQGVNDIFIAGSFGLVSHFNGLTWHHYTGIEVPSISGRYNAVSFRGNTVVAVGYRDSEHAIILMGTRNQ